MKVWQIFLLSFLIVLNPGKAEEKPVVFPEIKDWKISDEIQSFDPETLFEYINGAADMFLIYDFQVLKVATYIGKGEGEEVPEIDVEVYNQKNSDNSYGMYSQERPSKPDMVNIGAQGYKEGSMLNFIAGEYYVKIDSHNNSEKTRQAINSIAQQLAKNLSKSSSLPEILKVFPDKGKTPNTDMYISKDFLGHRFLTNVYRFDYNDKNQDYTLFLIKKEEIGECEDIIKKYLEFCKKPADMIKEGQFRFSDRYNGEITMVWKDKYIWGSLVKEKSSGFAVELDYIKSQLKDLKLLK